MLTPTASWRLVNVAEGPTPKRSAHNRPIGVVEALAEGQEEKDHILFVFPKTDKDQDR